MVLYDKLAIKQGILLDLPMREAIRAVTHDKARPHHPIDLINTPTWVQLATNLGVIGLNGVNEYLECPNADSLDLDFIAGDFSIGGWINWADNGGAEIVIGRYEIDVSGWEVYLELNGGIDYLSIRHHHAGGVLVRTGSFSVGWDRGVWTHFGISRVGGVITMYRNGVAVAVTTTVGGMEDPETCAQDLVIGTRFTKNANYLEAQIQGFTIHGRVLTAAEWAAIYADEEGMFP